MRKVDRRQFTQEASLAFLAGVSVSVASCGGGGSGGSGDDGYGPPTSGTPTTLAAGSKSGSVSANHGHQAVITAAELQSTGTVMVNIAGSAGHPHIVELPAQAVQQIRDNHKVEKESTMTDAHTHVVTFNVEVPEEPSRY
jgi:hypothetical protein